MWSLVNEALVSEEFRHLRRSKGIEVQVSGLVLKCSDRLWGPFQAWG